MMAYGGAMIGRSYDHQHEKIEGEYMAHLKNWSYAQVRTRIE
jgi:hypothetical protein